MGRKKQSRESAGHLFPVSLEEAEAEALRALDVAIARYNPSKVFAMFSGGDDSLTSTILTSRHPRFTGCLHINTGIGVKETNQFVRDTCARQKWPLVELHPTDKTYEDFVLEYGFPGPAAHRYAYVWLKERALNFFVSNVAKNSERDRVMLVTGARTTESKRRMGKARLIQRDACKVWVNPLFYWEKRQCLDFIAAAGVERNPVVQLIHMSGECLCGAYANQDETNELGEVALFYPETAARIRELERKAEGAGVHCRWGVAPAGEQRLLSDSDMPLLAMCGSCEARQTGGEFIVERR